MKLTCQRVHFRALSQIFFFSVNLTSRQSVDCTPFYVAVISTFSAEERSDCQIDVRSQVLRRGLRKPLVSLLSDLQKHAKRSCGVELLCVRWWVHRVLFVLFGFVFGHLCVARTLYGFLRGIDLGIEVVRRRAIWERGRWCTILWDETLSSL